MGLGFTELLLILILVLFFLGGKRLPQIGEGLGRSITEFKKSFGGAPSREKGRIEDSSRLQEGTGTASPLPPPREKPEE